MLPILRAGNVIVGLIALHFNGGAAIPNQARIARHYSDYILRKDALIGRLFGVAPSGLTRKQLVSAIHVAYTNAANLV